MIEKTKLMRSRLSLQASQILSTEDSVLELIAPTSQVILCRRSGNLVNSSYCTYFCETNREQNLPFDSEGGDACCVFAYDERFGRLSDAALCEC